MAKKFLTEARKDAILTGIIVSVFSGVISATLLLMIQKKLGNDNKQLQ
jgi:hypothetical protein